jgi:hypothetical protein
MLALPTEEAQLEPGRQRLVSRLMSVDCPGFFFVAVKLPKKQLGPVATEQQGN